MFDFLDDLFNSTENADFSVDEELRPGMAYLSDLAPGTEFLIGDEVYIMLENVGHNECRVIRKQFLRDSMAFGTNANWNSSPIRNYLNEDYYNRIAAVIGAENIIPMQRDLTSLDGLDDYGVCTDMVSLLTAAEYAKYHRILGTRSRYSNWWWTITPVSAPSNDYTRYVCYVRSNGALGWDGCGNGGGVRPFLTLESSIFVLKHDAE